MAETGKNAENQLDDAALDDVSATEWRFPSCASLPTYQKLHSMMSVLPNGGVCDVGLPNRISVAALDDVSATEWRLKTNSFRTNNHPLHSMMSVLPNGGKRGTRSQVLSFYWLHSMMSVLPNGGLLVDSHAVIVVRCTR